MRKHKNPTVVKVIILFTLVIFSVASLSPDLMFSLFGSSEMEPFGRAIYQGPIFGIDTLGGNIGTTKDAGIIAMIGLLIITLIFYIFYKILKSIYRRFKTANKAIKKDV